MVSFQTVDILILVLFFAVILSIGFISGKGSKNEKVGYLLSGRNLNLPLFVLTTVATWYGGILGVGEFTYSYGLLSWFTQGLPYYIFAIIFAFLFAGKIRNSELITIPDKLEQVFGKRVRSMASVLIYILVSPAPYLLMLASLLKIVFGLGLLESLIITAIFPLFYIIKAGYKADVLADAFQFFVMFLGFIVIVYFAISDFGGLGFLENNLPKEHLEFTGGASPVYILVWFLIALWTFTDPGFHQRANAAKNINVAKWGIVISVFFWFLFDFLTTTTGLFSRALLPNLDLPVLSFPLLAEKILPAGYKGIFYAALIATILSTYNSMLFLSATTLGNDIIPGFKFSKKENIPFYAKLGIIITSVISVIIAYYFQSVVEIWYVIGSICIPGIILLVVSAYFPKFRISGKFAAIELVLSVIASIIWFFIKDLFDSSSVFYIVEPMIVGLIVALSIHCISLIIEKGKPDNRD